MAQRGAGLPASLATHSRVVINPQAPAARRQSSTRWQGVVASSGSQAAPLLAIPAWAISRSAPRGKCRPITAPPFAPPGDQFACHGIAESVEFGIGHDPITPDQGRMIGAVAGGGSQDIAEAFLAQQIGA